MDELQDQVGQITAPCCSDEIFKGSFASKSMRKIGNTRKLENISIELRESLP